MKNTAALISFILGIFSVLLFFIPILNLCIILAAIILGIIGLTRSRESGGKGFAIAGIGLSILSIIICLVALLSLLTLITPFFTNATYADDGIADQYHPDQITSTSISEDGLDDLANPAAQTSSIQPPRPVDSPIEETPAEGQGFPSGSELDIYNDDIAFVPDQRRMIPELSFLRTTMELLKEKRWDGVSRLPLSISDYDAAYLDRLNEEQEYQDDIIIPDQSTDYFLSAEAQGSIRAEMLNARQEYLMYLAKKGVNSKYIRQLSDVALNQENMHYMAVNDPDAPNTAVDPVDRSDHSRLKLDLYAFDIYNAMKKMDKAGILGDPVQKDKTYHWKLIRMAVRYLMFHEMTHALQRAYDTLNAPEDRRAGQAAWIYNEKPLYLADTRYHRNWGSDSSTLLNNKAVATESQAEGAAYEITVDTIRMSDTQKRLIWEYLYGYLDDAQKDFDASFDIFESDYPHVVSDSFGMVIYKDFVSGLDTQTEPGQTLSRLIDRLGDLPAYCGYLHPMLPEDMHNFWDYLK